MTGCAGQSEGGAPPSVDDRFHRGDRAAIPAGLRQPGPTSRPVTIAPAGTWHLRRTPERFVAYQSLDAEIALSVGRGDGLVALFDRAHLAMLQRCYLDQLPGVGIDLEPVVDLPFAERVDPEFFYAFDVDAVLIDPRLPIAFWGWQPEQLARVSRRVAPFVGNFIRWRDDSWGPAYPRYELDDYALRVADLFGRAERYRQLARFRRATLQRIQERLPPAAERPPILVLNYSEDFSSGRFHLVDITDGALRTRQYRDLGCRQAWDADELALGQHGACDYETLATIDPAVIFVSWGLTKSVDAADFHRRFVAPLAAHPVGHRLRAVREQRVYPGGSGSQGPLTHLFQVELAVQQLYPERFGAWAWGTAPNAPLVDRAALAALVAGR